MKSLSESRSLRFATFSAFYFAQGVPIGLLTIALPAYFGEQGRSAEEVGLFLAVVGFPWGVKLIMGPFMDRLTFLPMGFRRPWVLIAQTGLVFSFVLMAVFGSAEGDLALLMALGFISNSFAATQDVAVDGMAIDILPVEDRGRANSFMAFGQVAGYSSFGYICSFLITTAGLATTAIVCAVTVAIILAIGIVVRERAGEKRLPWTEGTAVDVDHEMDPAISTYFRQLIKVLLLPTSLILIGMELLNRIRDGFANAILPVFATQEVGVTGNEFAGFYAAMGVTAAVTGIFFGPVIDKVGAKRFLFVAFLASAAIHIGFVLMSDYWTSMPFVIGSFAAVLIVSQLIFVAFIVLAMNICQSQMAATQFAIYMSLSNLSRTVGSGILAAVGANLSFSDEFVLMGGLLIAAAAVLWFFKEERRAP